MKRVLSILCTILAVALVDRAAAQGINNVRINEVLVHNENNYMDDYGHRSSWIELFNSGYEAVNIAQCYLEVERADGSTTRYQIPKDPATAMHAQTYLVFFCEGTDTKGTFYTNFTLDEVVKITLYNAGGKEEINSFAFDHDSQRPDVSVGWMSPDGIAAPQVLTLPKTTPGATNETISTVSKGERFLEQDPLGGVMATIAMSVVFIALVLIFFVLKVFGLVMMRIQQRKEAKPAEVAPAPAKRKPAGEQVQEELAAAALALKMFQEEQHILESTVITINRASRVYSPWSSKIHGIPAIPKR